ncbi:MAG: hypothetical protein V1797_10990 [Pseudomonadota bacterium]
MSPAAAEGANAWQETNVRFYAGGRADETPRELFWQGSWQPVRLIAEEQNAPAGAGEPPWRQFRLTLPAGGRVVLRGRGGAWQAKNLTAFGPGC